MRLSFPGGSVLHLADGRTVPLISVRIVYRCATEGCGNSVRYGGPARCAAHATHLDILAQLRAFVFQIDQVLAWYLARKWARA